MSPKGTLLFNEPFDLSYLNLYQHWQGFTIFLLRSDENEIYFLFLSELHTCAWSYSLICPGMLFPWRGKCEHRGAYLFFMNFTQLKKKKEEVNLVKLFYFLEFSTSLSENGYSIWHMELLWGLTPVTLLDGVQEQWLNVPTMRPDGWAQTPATSQPAMWSWTSCLKSYNPQFFTCKVGLTMIIG